MYFTPLNNIAIFSREVSSLKSRILSSDTDYHTGENLRTVDGQIPLVSCPLGYLIDNYVSYLKDSFEIILFSCRKYRANLITNPLTMKSQREDGCKPCPRGRYGDTIGLISYRCTAMCPAGKYGDLQGATSIKDCKDCPPGTYGKSRGLITAECSKKCPAGKYSDTYGNTVASSCKVCPPNYFQWQCSYSLKEAK